MTRKLGTDSLTDKQRAFVSEYLVDKNATAAYIRAGYTARGNAAEASASQLLRNPKIRAEIDKRLAFLMERVEITPERILQELAAIAFADTNDYVQIVEMDGIEYDAKGDPRLDEDGVPKTYKYQTVAIKPTDQLTRFQRKAIKSIKQGKDGIEIHLHDKQKALELLGRNHKLFVDKTELSGADGQPFEVLFNIPRPPKQNKVD